MNGRDIALLGGLVGEVMDDEGDDYGDEEDSLYLAGDDDDMGAAPRFRRGFAPRGRRRMSKRRAAARRRVEEAVIAPAPGLPARGPKYLPLVYAPIQFVNAGALTIQTQAQTQKPFKGVRLIVVEARSAATVVGLLTISTFTMGVQPQQVNINNMPAGAFAPGAFQVDLALDEVEPGVLSTIAYTLSVTPPVGETLDVATMILGLTIA